MVDVVQEVDGVAIIRFVDSEGSSAAGLVSLSPDESSTKTIGLPVPVVGGVRCSVTVTLTRS